MEYEEELSKFRRKLEEAVEEHRERFQKRADELNKDGLKDVRIIVQISHDTYVDAVNGSLRAYCENYNVPYEPIKSRLKIN